MRTALEDLEYSMRGMKHAKVGHVTLHSVEFNTDTTEGRGRAYYEYFLDSGLAKQRAKGRYVMGSDCPVKTVSQKVAVVGDQIFLIGDEVVVQYEDPQVIRERALSKLTPEERLALGIK